MRKGAVSGSLAAVMLLAASCTTSPPAQRVLARAATATQPATTEPTTTTIVPSPPTTVRSPSGGAPAPVPAPPCEVPSVTAGLETHLATPTVANLEYSASPGGPTVGHLQVPWGGPGTRPVLDQSIGWVAILLNTRPNGSAGWVPAARVVLTATPYRILVSICQRSLTLYQGTEAVYSSQVGVGRPQTPTPVGSSFVDAVFITPRVQLSIFGPTVFVLGAHSNVFSEFDGGDGMVSIHGYPSDPASTRGVASSHGCIRASPETINALKVVPVGTPVDIVR